MIAKVLKRISDYRYLVMMENHKRQVHVEQMLKFSAKCHNQVGMHEERNQCPSIIVPTVPAAEEEKSQGSIPAPEQEVQPST